MLRYLFLPSVPDPARLSEACESGTRALSCQVELMQVRAHRLAPTFASIVTILVLLVLAEGLRRGRRFAWWGTVVANVALAAVGLAAVHAAPAVVALLAQGL